MTRAPGRFLTDASERGRTRRSRTGNILLVLLFPALLGVMACYELPVPVGDPEQSVIDPELSGVWLGRQEDGLLLLILKPYDRRTWLVMCSGLEPVETPAQTDDATAVTEGAPPAAAGAAEDDVASPAQALDLLRNGGLGISETILFKGWLTPMEGILLMTWEPLAEPNSETGLDPQIWLISRLTKQSSDEFLMDFINSEFLDLDKVQTRAQAEDIIRRNLDDPKLFITGSDVPGYQYTRIHRADYDRIGHLLKDSGFVRFSD